MPFDIDKRKKWMANYYINNREKLLEYSKNYQKNNRQQISCKMLYKPSLKKCYNDNGIKQNTLIEKKKVVVNFD
jgi:hypothetical protein